MAMDKEQSLLINDLRAELQTTSPHCGHQDNTHSAAARSPDIGITLLGTTSSEQLYIIIDGEH